MKCCIDCRYFVKEDIIGGECHRYPPPVASDRLAEPRFPRVYCDSWCGEFSAPPPPAVAGRVLPFMSREELEEVVCH